MEGTTSSESDKEINISKKRKVKRYKRALYRNYETDHKFTLSEATRLHCDFLRNQTPLISPTINFDPETLQPSTTTHEVDQEETSGSVQQPIFNYENESLIPDTHIQSSTTTNKVYQEETSGSVQQQTSNYENESLPDTHIKEHEELDPSVFENSYSNSNSCDLNQVDHKNASSDGNDISSDYSHVEDHYYSNVSDNYTDSDDNNENFDDTVLFAESKCTIRDVMTMVMAFSLRFKLPDIGRSELTKMLKLLAGPKFQNINMSKYILNKAFNPPDEKIMYHYFCEHCNKKILYSVSKKQFKKQNFICQSCNESTNISLKSRNYFISTDLSYQLKMLFLNLEMKSDIFNFMQKKQDSVESNIVKDVHNSELYKSFSTKNVLTYNFSTDGAPLTKSGKRGFWPLQISLNFLPPKKRFKYVLLAGILMCTKEPNSDLASLYFSKFNEQVFLLHNEGINVTDLENRKVNLRFRPFACCVDSKCRPVLQNRLQFNAYYGCSWCYHRGIYCVHVKGIRYLIEENDSELRSHKSQSDDLKVVTSSKRKDEKGLKGDISLSQIPGIDMVWSFSYDYLHGILSGVEQQIYRQWTSTKLQSIFKLNNNEIKSIENRLKCIKPTQDIHRRPGTLKDKESWKGSQLKFWILCFSLPCLSGILNDNALQHYSLLVKSMYTLLKPEITYVELLECERDLVQFVILYQTYFGENAMTFNIHTLLHVVQSVKKTGNLWATSTFPFESNIYTLKTFLNGPNGMDQQMSIKTFQVLHFKTGNVQYSSAAVKEYCTNLFIYKNVSKFYDCGENDVIFFGKCNFKDYKGKLCKIYKKCIYKGKVLHSVKYQKVKCTDDTMIELKDGRYGRILNILKIDNKCYLEISTLSVFKNKPFNVSHIEKIESENLNKVLLVPINDVSCKRVLVNVHNAQYLCKLPNDFEAQ